MGNRYVRGRDSTPRGQKWANRKAAAIQRASATEWAKEPAAHYDPMDPKQAALLTWKELEAALGVTRSCIDMWKMQGMPVFELAKRAIIRDQRAQILYDLEAVKAWRASRTWGTRELKSERKSIDQAVYDIVEEQAPMTVRQVYYQAVVAHLVPKTDKGYDKIKNMLVKMREATIADDNGDEFDKETPRMPLDWLVDNGRVVYDRNSFTNPAAALAAAARNYTRSYWQDRDERVYVWLEKDALASVVSSAAAEYDVSLMVARGVNSISFIYRVAKTIEEHGCDTTIHYFRDLDPTGVVAPDAVQQLLDKLLPDGPKAKVIERAITMKQVQDNKLEETAQPTKKDDNKHYPNFARVYGEDHPSFELDALPPKVLRQLVHDCIKEHVTDKEHEEALTAEREDRELIADLVAGGPSDFAWDLAAYSDPIVSEQAADAGLMDLAAYSDPIVSEQAAAMDAAVEAEAAARLAKEDLTPEQQLQESILDLYEAGKLPNKASIRAAVKAARVSLTITQAQKIELRARGYTDEQIREMTPAAAHRILGLE
jgi:hypothetical protein